MNSKQAVKFFFPFAFSLLLGANPAWAQDDSPHDWKWGAEAYLWGASLGGSTTSGQGVDVDIDTIIDDLQFGFMGLVAAEKNKWRVFADMIYLDLKEDDSASASVDSVSVSVDASLELKGFITTAGAGYEIYDASGTSLDAVGGVRYLWLESELEIDATASVITEDIREKDTGNNLDAVVGLQGRTHINDDWFLSYYADIGAGDSDLTWQATAAVNYRLESFDLTLGYRYLKWEFDDFGPFDDLDLSGVFAGAKFYF